MKSLLLLLAFGCVLPLCSPGAVELSAAEIALRMRQQANTQVVVPGRTQGLPPRSEQRLPVGSNAPINHEDQQSTVARDASANSANAAKSEAIELEILFEFSSPKLAPVAISQLNELCKAFQLASDIQQPFTIIGHTDAVGNQASNLKLSKARADAVRLYLVDKCDIESARLRADGKGEAQLRPGLNPRDPRHRRVEVKIGK